VKFDVFRAHVYDADTDETLTFTSEADYEAYLRDQAPRPGAAVSEPYICYRCGRRGERGFMVIRGRSGIGAWTDPHAQLVCSNAAACERRQRKAEKDQRWT
jgi:hypothetical protein